MASKESRKQKKEKQRERGIEFHRRRLVVLKCQAAEDKTHDNIVIQQCQSIGFKTDARDEPS